MDPIAQGDWSLFGGAIDPQVHWVITNPVVDPVALTGTYVCLFSFLLTLLKRV